jgi:hypothetical protein
MDHRRARARRPSTLQTQRSRLQEVAAAPMGGPVSLLFIEPIESCTSSRSPGSPPSRSSSPRAPPSPPSRPLRSRRRPSPLPPSPLHRSRPQRAPRFRWAGPRPTPAAGSGRRTRAPPATSRGSSAIGPPATRWSSASTAASCCPNTEHELYNPIAGLAVVQEGRPRHRPALRLLPAVVPRPRGRGRRHADQDRDGNSNALLGRLPRLRPRPAAVPHRPLRARRLRRDGHQRQQRRQRRRPGACTSAAA